uniref:Protein kinase superfamily protein n=1 Tax=Tanacetum cinerariifolium TaxID=118510 RepID=A0A6L2N9A0_TANCI|nr:protein kinase superfamily protein [Tanacetum cinerariifolium]
MVCYEFGAQGTSQSCILGEATINLADYSDASQPAAIFLPLIGSDHGTILHVSFQLLTAKTRFRSSSSKLGMLDDREMNKALSTRPDILPSAYRTELAKLQVAIRSIETQLGAPISQLFVDISPKPMATASLVQVYKAYLHTRELVAVKVQMPDLWLSLTLDALLFNMIRGQLKRFAKAGKDIIVAVNETVRHMFDEIDYIHKGHNCERFASLYGFHDCFLKMNFPKELKFKFQAMRTSKQ